MQNKASVILYTRPGCHLCEEAKSQLSDANCTDLYELEEINIDSDSVLEELYGKLIPVIAINGKDVFRYRVAAKAFKTAIMNACKPENISQ